MLPILSDSEFIISDVEVKHISPNFFTESINGKANAKSRGLHRVEIKCSVHLVNADDIKKFEALMLRIRGRLNPFKLSLQDRTDGKGFCNPLFTDVSPMLANDVSVGQNQITLAGFSGVIPAGSKFQFPNDAKIHTILHDVKPNQSCEFFPAARVAHSTKARLNFSPEPIVRLTSDEFSIKYENAAEYQITMLEAL